MRIQNLKNCANSVQTWEFDQSLVMCYVMLWKTPWCNVWLIPYYTSYQFLQSSSIITIVQQRKVVNLLDAKIQPYCLPHTHILMLHRLLFLLGLCVCLLCYALIINRALWYLIEDLQLCLSGVNSNTKTHFHLNFSYIILFISAALSWECALLPWWSMRGWMLFEGQIGRGGANSLN